MGQITAEIVAHSLSPQEDELISVLCTFPRIILAEMNTHRMLSKNTSSSRAIPFNKMVESIKNDPFVPIAWQKEHKGMQGNEYITHPNAITIRNTQWLVARDKAVDSANALSSNYIFEEGTGVTKQLCNRLLEPFMWTTMLITGPRSGWDNFFNLRCPQYEIAPIRTPGERTYKSKKDAVKNHPGTVNYIKQDWLDVNKGQAEIHIMDLAEKIYDAVNESFPTQILPTMWHVPFRKKINELYPEVENDSEDIVKISVSMAARASYTVVGTEKILTKEEHISLHDRLLTQDPPHSSPMEHCAQAMSDEQYYTSFRGGMNGFTQYDTPKILDTEYGWCRNFRGFIPYRHIIETKKYGDI